jgi:hypothetical protein
VATAGRLRPKCTLARCRRMRDWLYILVPIGVVIYFVVNPGQFTALMMWLERLVR